MSFPSKPYLAQLLLSHSFFGPDVTVPNPGLTRLQAGVTGHMGLEHFCWASYFKHFPHITFVSISTKNTMSFANGPVFDPGNFSTLSYIPLFSPYSLKGA